jgi:hypothetical protein
MKIHGVPVPLDGSPVTERAIRGAEQLACRRRQGQMRRLIGGMRVRHLRRSASGLLVELR